jgi:hypothetical protein
MNRKTFIIVGLCATLFSCKKEGLISGQNESDMQQAPETAIAAVTVTGVPATEASYFGINTGYYRKYVPLGIGTTIPIVSASNVSDAAFDRAATLLNLLVRTYPSYAMNALRQQRIYVAIFGNTEYPNVLPGWPTWVDATRYGGGFGPTTSFRVCGIHEGDILKNGYDRYPLENIVVHEFEHAIKNFVLEIYNSSFAATVQNLYNSARAAGKWNNTYAAVNAEEYWAECAQSYFNVNTDGPINGDGVHNYVNTRSELQAYDAGIYNLLNQTYNGQTLPPGSW